MADMDDTKLISVIERGAWCIFERPEGNCNVEDSYNHKLGTGDCAKCQCHHPKDWKPEITLEEGERELALLVAKHQDEWQDYYPKVERLENKIKELKRAKMLSEKFLSKVKLSYNDRHSGEDWIVFDCEGDGRETTDQITELLDIYPHGSDKIEGLNMHIVGDDGAVRVYFSTELEVKDFAELVKKYGMSFDTTSLSEIITRHQNFIGALQRILDLMGGETNDG